jgi:AcrR family transcriptional regulator
MALYRHVANKEDLLDGMVETVYSEIDLTRGGDFQATMRQRAISMREALRRHPWAVELMESSSPGPANLHYHHAGIACLREQAGLPIRTAIDAYNLMDSYIYGFALQEKTLPSDITAAAETRRHDLTTADPSFASRFPYLIEIAEELGVIGLRLHRSVRTRPRTRSRRHRTAPPRSSRPLDERGSHGGTCGRLKRGNERRRNYSRPRAGEWICTDLGLRAHPKDRRQRPRSNRACGRCRRCRPRTQNSICHRQPGRPRVSACSTIAVRRRSGPVAKCQEVAEGREREAAACPNARSCPRIRRPHANGANCRERRRTEGIYGR